MRFPPGLFQQCDASIHVDQGICGFPSRLSHETFPRGFPTGLSHVPPWCESILGCKSSQCRENRFPWNGLRHLGDCGNGGTILEFLSPFLWRAPSLEMRRNTRNSFPTTQGKDPSSLARRRKRGSSECGRDSRASSRVETGMSGNLLRCSKVVKDPLEVAEVRSDYPETPQHKCASSRLEGRTSWIFSSCGRCSRLTTGTSESRSGGLRKGQSPCELLAAFSGFHSRRCWVLRPCV